MPAFDLGCSSTWLEPQGSHSTKESLHKTLSTVALNQLKAGASIGNATFHLSRCSECFPSTLPGRKGALVRGSSVSGYRVKGKRGRRRYPGQTCDTKKDLGSQKRVPIIFSKCYLSPPRLQWAEQYLEHASWALCFSTVPQVEFKHLFTRTTAL